MKTRTALIALALLSACGERAPENAPADDPAGNASAADPAPAPVSAPGKLPPSDANLRFIGLWASDTQACTDTSWLFTERGLETAGGVSCAFDRINPVPGGYDIASVCADDAEETRDTVRLRFAESAEAMMLETDEVLEDVGLIYCGPAGEAAPAAPAPKGG